MIASGGGTLFFSAGIVEIFVDFPTGMNENRPGGRRFEFHSHRPMNYSADDFLSLDITDLSVDSASGR